MDEPNTEAASQKQANTIDHQSDWQQLSPIAIIYFAISVIKHLAGNIIYLLPALAFSYENILAHPFMWGPGLLTLLFLFIIFVGLILD